jgi:tetratricopeptide (TPR) repeat protein
VIAREPDNVDALRMRASCILQLALTGSDESLANAEEAVADVLELVPTEPTARAYRGVIAARNGDAERAIAELSFAIAHNVRWRDAYVFLAGARMQKGDFLAALEDLNQVTPLYGSVPLPSQLLWKRAQCYTNLGDLDHAIADFTTLITRHPTEYRVYRDRADAYVKKHEFKLAVTDRDEVVRLRPDDAESYFRRSLVRWWNGDKTAALADVDRMEQLRPRSCAPPLCRAAMTLLAGQDTDSALASLDRAIALEPNFALPYAMRAFAHGKKTEWLPATADLLLAIRRLALIKFKVCYEYKRLDDGRDHVFIWWEYKCQEAAPPAKREASNVERASIEFAVSSLLAAVLGPSDSTSSSPDCRTRK